MSIGRRGGIVAQDARQHVEEHALAVAAGAVDEHQRMLARDPGQAVAAPLLQEADQLGVASGRLGEEPEPERAIAAADGATAVDLGDAFSLITRRRSSPVRRSTVPPGVPRRNGSGSQASMVTANMGIALGRTARPRRRRSSSTQPAAPYPPVRAPVRVRGDGPHGMCGRSGSGARYCHPIRTRRRCCGSTESAPQSAPQTFRLHSPRSGCRPGRPGPRCDEILEFLVQRRAHHWARLGPEGVEIAHRAWPPPFMALRSERTATVARV